MDGTMIIVVGAGPAGLALAYELQRRRLPYQVLERDVVGSAWRHHYDRLHLHTLKGVSGLPGLPMPASYPDFPSRDEVFAYLNGYAEHFKLNIATGVDVERADWDGTRWSLRTSQGTMEATTLMVATGIWSTPYSPVFPGQERFRGTITHAKEYRNPQPFAGKRVLVIGAGNSGTEMAVDVSEAGLTTAIAIRGGVVFAPYPQSAPLMQATSWLMRDIIPRSTGNVLASLVYRDFSHLGIYQPAGPLIDAYPVVGYELPDAVAAGKVAVYGAIERFEEEQVVFADGRTYACDAVILATGYRPSVQFVAHELALDENYDMLLDRHWRSVNNRHLFCVGFWYPPNEGWLQALGRVVQAAMRGLPG